MYKHSCAPPPQSQQRNKFRVGHRQSFAIQEIGGRENRLGSWVEDKKLLSLGLRYLNFQPNAWF